MCGSWKDPSSRDEFVRLWDSLLAVSYTHLDVYKRQNIISEISTDYDLNLISTGGFEGEHFDKKEDGTIIAREGFKTGAELSKIGAGSIFNMSGLRPIQWYTDEHAQPISREQYLSLIHI